MTVESRGYDPEADLTRIQEFLFQIHLETESFKNWLPTRFENSHLEWVNDIRIWEESPGGRIMAITTPENKVIHYIHIRPGYPRLMDEAIRWIEAHAPVKKEKPDEAQEIQIICLDGDTEREEALRARGFRKSRGYGILRIRDLDAPIHDFQAPEGFIIRAVRGREDFEKIAVNVRIVFGHGEWFTADVLEGLARSSFYHRELDLVAEAPDGAIASFCTFRIDPRFRTTELEPMGTHPDYRCMGLARALIAEGMRRLKKYDPLNLYIDGAADNPAATRLYEATGFEEKGTYYSWAKKI